MDKTPRLSRRKLMKLVSGGAVGAAALTALKASGGEEIASAIEGAPDPVQVAQTATRRGLPRLKITDIKVIRSQVNGSQLCNVKIFTSEPGLYGVGDGNHAERPYLVGETIEKFLKPAVVGRYADEIEDIWQMASIAPVLARKR